MNNDDFIEMFEHEISEYTGAPYVIAVDRCTNAIFLVVKYLQMLGLEKDHEVTIPKQTYQSVPMTLIHAGLKVKFEDKMWAHCYQIGDLPLYDNAVGFDENMYIAGTYQTLSFQQKKRLGIGTGGAILTDNKEAADTLRRMRHDGRRTHISITEEISEAPEDIIFGYHMNMPPNQAAQGLLLLNQMSNIWSPGTNFDYPDISTLPLWNKIDQVSNN